MVGKALPLLGELFSLLLKMSAWWRGWTMNAHAGIRYGRPHGPGRNQSDKLTDLKWCLDTFGEASVSESFVNSCIWAVPLAITHVVISKLTKQRDREYP